MASRLHATHCRLILLNLFVILIAEQSAARKLTDGFHQKINHGDILGSSSSSSSSMEQFDPSLYTFFTLNDLKLGKKLAIYFPYSAPSATPKLLPREEADSIPFSTSHLQYLLSLFSFSEHSPQAKAVEYTLQQCELESIKGETKFCATSLESMLHFTAQMLGNDTQLKVLTSTRLSNSTVLVENYTIVKEPEETAAAKMVACHSMPYPYAVFYCHSQESENRVLEVSLEADNGDGVRASAICHMDTSQWDEDHASFRVLKTKPGASHVCHFVSTDSLVWMPNSAF